MHIGTGDDRTHEPTDDVDGDEALFDYLFGTADDADVAPEVTRWADLPA
jgi:hypothetical protein